MSIKPTNENIALAVCKSHPTASFARELGYDAEANTIDGAKLKLFGDYPEVANEFLSAMDNLIVSQYAFDLFAGYENPYDVFIKPMKRIGDIEQYLTSVLPTLGNYEEGKSPFATDKPTLKLSFIKTMEKKTANVKLIEEVWAGAFVSEGGLANICGIILKNLEDAIALFVYDLMTGVIGNTTYFGINKTITKVDGTGETLSATKAYEDIMALVYKMALPSTNYNEEGVRTFTKKGNLVLLLNADYKASFDINVLASLFNSKDIGTDRYFKEVRVVDMPASQTNQVGIVMDADKLVWGYRIKTGGAIYNPADMSMNTWKHAWIKYGTIGSKQAVRLITEE